MLIGELAARTGASTRSLRHYEDCDLLVPTRGGNGYRVYAESDVARVAKIRALIAAGLATATIREYLECIGSDRDRVQLRMCPGLRAQLDAVADRLDAQQAVIEQTRQRLCALTAPENA
ncbi:MerR family transcriptional regulator [Kineosporia succinea]|uniref:DNA-binding transcriptional MerR regulator n=1 Tax=Kineosporia succinea TaxID=84632 RepID=A0ABT9PAY4_9ACTN|nr:MerR family transcriptional regulator [Kineosporia succinea]MDP9829696.1 DNA-binding transcriptional MerR regulator [Kineosporia succinea]